ncbi:MerR family transcriptional regulator [Spongiibacter sp. KMU-158]|uniref:MerR family transcriptional regulator n=1 Tax=Spongiibacter pelagi TaxID=2760804 RepID=A0A927C1R3_9GAMM|nr:MerR family transcriptional regulator [Spongiibacter pelagi]MBD2858563.1 MerR family transcriptional regulator [Spongiibacter pelagi]
MTRESIAKETLESVAQFLPQSQASEKAPRSQEGNKEYSVEELAISANTSVRNIRAYQDRGVLPPPALRGRKGIYSSQHLSRLRLIANLLERGYTLSSIRELLNAVENGVGINEILGMETAINSPWGREEPITVSMAELVKMFGTKLTPAALKKASDLGLFQASGSKMRVESMNTLEVAAKLCSTGIPLEELLEITANMRGHIQGVADTFVKLVAEHVLKPFGNQPLPPREEFPAIADLVWQLRPLAEIVVDAELGRAMDIAAGRFLGDQLEQILKRLPRTEVPSVPDDLC